MAIERIETGVPGLDEILKGGLPAGGSYLLLGQPGTGKTTLCLQFLVEGVRHGEKCLYLSMAESRGQLQVAAQSFGWTLEGIDVYEMRRRGRSAGDGDRAGYTVFSPSEVELEEIFREVLAEVDKVRPSRLVLDSLSEIRMLAEDPARYRRELLALNDHLALRPCTSWLVDLVETASDTSVAETIVNGVLLLEHLLPAYGGDRRRLHLRKLRASSSLGGYHDFCIHDQGIDVYPRLVTATHRAAAHSSAALPSGVSGLDALLGGGLDGGTSTVLLGAAGTGKSTVAAQFVAAGAARGVRGAIFCFDENPTNLLIRTSSLGIPLAEQVKEGKAELIPVEPAEYSPGQLSDRIRKLVDEGARIVVLDSVNGYVNALPEERLLLAYLHELLGFLAEKGTATILTAEHGILGGGPAILAEISYLADTVLLFRCFEEAGVMKQALSVVKKRTGNHERSSHELTFGPRGIDVGPPLAAARLSWPTDVL